MAYTPLLYLIALLLRSVKFTDKKGLKEKKHTATVSAIVEQEVIPVFANITQRFLAHETQANVVIRLHE